MDKRMTSSGSDVWVFSERMDVTLELLGKGRELADGLGAGLCALVLGTALEHEADTFASHGADKVFLVENQALQNTLPEPFAEAIGKLASQYGPEILLIGSTRRGKDIAARVAARLETGVITDCVALGLDKEKRMLVADRPSYGGILVSTEICTTRPQIATVPPRVFEPATPRQGQHGKVIRTDVDLAPPKTRVVQVASKEVRGVGLEDASVIVSAGRGVAKKEDLRILQELASVLGGEVGCSSPLAEDLKWLPLERLVGLTGRKVKPKLYVACGISGQVQHITGMRGSRTVVAINNDPEAPIFQQSDYCVRGDLYEIVPLLTEAFRKIRQK
ncbi:MAG: electron transfer flavoprotein subunit alpha/FixB family protein [Nitrososphaerales archaeon]|jgi:electron transfer flavoprotein alpha subunit